MSKKNIVAEDSEFRYLEENFEKMMEEMQRDRQTQDFQVSQEWDQKFRKVIDDTLEEAQKQSRRRKWKNVVIAAGVVLLATVGLDCGLVAVRGDGLMEVVESVFRSGDKNIVTFGTAMAEELGEKEDDEIFFDTSSLEKAYEQIRQELRMPMFYISYIPEGYQLEEAKYDRKYRVLNMDFEKDGKKIYVSQQQISDGKATGAVMDDKQSGLVINEALNREIPVHRSEQDGAYIFAIEQGTLILNCRVSGSLSECEKVIKSIYFQ